MEMATSKRNINGTTRMEKKDWNRNQLVEINQKKNQAIQGCHSNKSELSELIFFPPSHKYNYMNKRYEKVNWS